MLVYSFALDSEPIRRPCPECAKSWSLDCLGMPSGHSETAAMVSILLFTQGVISFPVAIVLILLFGLQRIYANRHTPAQVLVGWTMGALYAAIYSAFLTKKTPWSAPLLGIGIAAALSIAVTLRINSLLHAAPPVWLDKALYPILETKQNVSPFRKYMYSMLPLVNYSTTPVYSWQQLETSMDGLLAAIEGTERYDVVVGIKSGGAILASYVHSKRPTIPTYYFKAKKTMMNGSDSTILSEAYSRYVAQNAEYSFKVIEGIEDSLEGKTVLLFDETLETGDTILYAKEYLEKEKKAARVIMGVMNVPKIGLQSPVMKFNPYVAMKSETITIWPWGYDN